MAEILSDIALEVEFYSEVIEKMIGIEKTGTMAVVNLPDISKLPEGVSINVNGSPYGFEPGDTVYIYSWNEKTKMLTVQGKVQADGNSGILIDVRSEGPYLLTSELAKPAAGSETTVDNGIYADGGTADSGKTSDIPKTGDDSNAATWIVIAVSAALGAAVTMLRTRRRKQH